MDNDNIINNAQELAEVNERIKVVDSEITRLQGLRFGLSLRQAKLEETEMTAHIGRCFSNDGCYARVIAAPAWRGSIPGLTFGEKDFPVLTVANYSLVPFALEKIPVEFDHWGWTEVPPEEFMHAFNAAVRRLSELVEKGYRE